MNPSIGKKIEKHKKTILSDEYYPRESISGINDFLKEKGVQSYGNNDPSIGFSRKMIMYEGPDGILAITSGSKAKVIFARDSAGSGFKDMQNLDERQSLDLLERILTDYPERLSEIKHFHQIDSAAKRFDLKPVDSSEKGIFIDFIEKQNSFKNNDYAIENNKSLLKNNYFDIEKTNNEIGLNDYGNFDNNLSKDNKMDYSTAIDSIKDVSAQKASIAEKIEAMKIAREDRIRNNDPNNEYGI